MIDRRVSWEISAMPFFWTQEHCQLEIGDTLFSRYADIERYRIAQRLTYQKTQFGFKNVLYWILHQASSRKNRTKITIDLLGKKGYTPQR